MNENPGIDFKSVFGDGEGFTVAREMTPEELASAKPCVPPECPPILGGSPDIEDYCGLTSEEFEEAVREASEMSQRALDRAEQTLLQAEQAHSNEVAERFIRIHDRWLRFAQIVAS